MVNNNGCFSGGCDTSLFLFGCFSVCLFLVQKQGPEPIGYSNGSLFKKQNPQSP